MKETSSPLPSNRRCQISLISWSIYTAGMMIIIFIFNDITFLKGVINLSYWLSKWLGSLHIKSHQLQSDANIFCNQELLLEYCWLSNSKLTSNIHKSLLMSNLPISKLTSILQTDVKLKQTDVKITQLTGVKLTQKQTYQKANWHQIYTKANWLCSAKLDTCKAPLWPWA